MAPRIGIGGIWHETNTFAARPTELADFRSNQYAQGAALIERYAGTGTELGGMERTTPLPVRGAGRPVMLALPSHAHSLRRAGCRAEPPGLSPAGASAR